MLVRFIIIAIFYNTTSFAAEYFISEIYARHSGPDHNGTHWIELSANKDPIEVKTLRLETYDKSNAVLFSHTEQFLKPVVFASHLLIAATRDLGLPYCLKHNAIVIAPTLHIDFKKTKRICVTINNDRECSAVNLLTSKPGVAIYHDDPTAPVWRNEPCHLISSIFATPGKPAGYCSASPTMAEEVLDRCPYKPFFGQALNFKKVKHRDNHAPTITQAHLTHDQHGTKIVASFVDPDNGPWLITVCHAHRDTNKICHVMGPRHQVFPHVDNVVPVVRETIPPHHYVSIEIADITGAMARTTIAHADANDSPFTHKTWQPSIARRQTPNGSELVFTLSPKELPLNLLLESASIKFHQGSFIKAGVHNIALPKAIHDNSVTVALAGPQGKLKFEI